MISRENDLYERRKKVLTKTSQRLELLKTGALFFLLNSPLLATRTDDLIATSVKQSHRLRPILRSDNSEKRDD
jgi:hypothetical protein